MLSRAFVLQFRSAPSSSPFAPSASLPPSRSPVLSLPPPPRDPSAAVLATVWPLARLPPTDPGPHPSAAHRLSRPWVVFRALLSADISHLAALEALDGTLSAPWYLNDRRGGVAFSHLAVALAQGGALLAYLVFLHDAEALVVNVSLHFLR